MTNKPPYDQKAEQLIESLMLIFSVEPPAFAMSVLSIATGLVIAHCNPEARAGMTAQHLDVINNTIDSIQGPPKNETH